MSIYTTDMQDSNNKLVKIQSIAVKIFGRGVPLDFSQILAE